MTTTMWAQRLVGPYSFDTETLPTPTSDQLNVGEVILRLVAAGICGSDLPFFRGVLSPFSPLIDGRYVSPPGAPLHEIVGQVVASRDITIGVGARVVGWASGNDALMEYVVADGEGLIECDPSWPPEDAVILQPLACVFHALSQIPAIKGAVTAVIGQGPIGLLFSHVLKTMGARHVIGVDSLDRREVAHTFSVDEMIHASSSHWAAQLTSESERPTVVIEAIGHQTTTLTDAVEAMAMHGHIYYFGIPDDPVYPFPMYAFLRKHGRLTSGTTLPAFRKWALTKAAHHLHSYPDIQKGYVTDTFPVADVNAAFQVALTPASGQLKVVLTATSPP